jgi:hypothetical protein
MRLSRVSLLVLFGVALLSTPSSAGSPTGDEVTLEAAVKFRESMALRADEEFVRRTLSDPEAFPNARYGVPLSEAEAEELLERARLLASTEDAQEWAYKQPNFAGVYVDQARGGVSVFLFTDSINQVREQLVSMIPSGQVIVEKAQFSLDELYRLKRQVLADVESLGKQGIEVNSVGLSLADNRVLIGVGSDLEEARATIRGEYPEGITIHSQGVLRPDVDCNGGDVKNCPPVKGGIRIFRTIDLNPTHNCTSGYLSRIQGEARVVMVTAGHCMKEPQQGTLNRWYHLAADFPNDWFGPADLAHSYWCCNDPNADGTDIGIITVNDPPPDAQLDRVLAVNNPPDVQKINRIVPDSAPQQNEEAPICRMGYGSKYIIDHNEFTGYTALKCGQISGTDMATRSCEDDDFCDEPGECRNPWCKWVDHLNRVDFDSTGGDSGGTMFTAYNSTQVYLLGTHSDSRGDNDGANGPGFYVPVGQGIAEIYNRSGGDIFLEPCTVVNPC